MPDRESSELPRRVRVHGARRQRYGSWLIAGVAAILFLGMMVAGSLDSPQPPTPVPIAGPRLPTPTVLATPPPPYPGRLFTFGARYDETRSFAERRFLRVTAGARASSLLTIDGLQHGMLASTGDRLYAVSSTGLAAIDAQMGTIIWHHDAHELAPGYSATIQSLALSADGQTLAAYRQGRDAPGHLRQFDLLLITTTTGAATRIPVAATMPWTSSLFFAADPDTMYMIAGGALQRLTLDTGITQTVVDATDGDLVAAMAPDQRHLYITNGLETIIVYDTLQHRQERTLPLPPSTEEGALRPQSMQIAPDGTRAALLVSYDGIPTIERGRVVSLPSRHEIMLINTSTGAVEHRTPHGEGGWWQLPTGAFNPRASIVYFTRESTLQAWDIAANTINQAAVLAGANESAWSGVILSADDPGTLAGAPLRTPIALPVPTATPQPTPLLMAETTPFVWIARQHQRTLEIHAYSLDGSQRVLASQVHSILPRRAQPPLLLMDAGPDQTLIYDPASEQRVVLAMSAWALPVPRRDSPAAPPVIVSPDGTALAFVTSRDPLPDDAVTTIQQLVLANLQTGEIRVVNDAATVQTLTNGAMRVVGWTTDGLYLLQTMTLAAGDVPLALWRIDPSGTAAPQEILKLPELIANLEIHAAAGVILYESTPPNLEQAELRLRTVETGIDLPIYAGPFLDRGQVSLAPDGMTVAYLQPMATPNKRQIALYQVATGKTVYGAIVTVQPWSSAPLLRWSADSTTLFVRTHENPLALTDEERAIHAGTGAQRGTRHLPPLEGITRDEHPRLMGSADEQRTVRMSMFEDGGTLTLYTADTGQQPQVSLPISRTSSGESIPMWQENYQLIYVP